MNHAEASYQAAHYAGAILERCAGNVWPETSVLARSYHDATATVTLHYRHDSPTDALMLVRDAYRRRLLVSREAGLDTIEFSWVEPSGVAVRLPMLAEHAPALRGEAA